jgi:putative nucleotidyltransferase with HDIG domain
MTDKVKIDKKFFDPTFPLMDKFRELAPGSYKHCQNVSNICEAVAAELALNTDLIKCAALYHDIGKMNNPGYFSENQSNGTNVHDNLEPFISFQIISRHVGDSVLHLLQLKDMPLEVIEIISQHHGDTILRAFHNKVENEPEDKFRYKCDKPETTESLILMIVDSVEATAKAFFGDPQRKEVDNINTAINGTIDRLTEDSQLDNMKIGTLKVTKRVLTKELESIYHKRVSYDDTKTIA